MSRQLRLDVAQLTDVGRKRPHNEDNMAYVIPKDEQVMARKGALFIVADGMGGHAAGEVASEIAVETVTVAYYQDENEEILPSLMNAIKRANAIIHQRAAENMLRSGMGTTSVAAVLRGNMAYIANVGDSRAYMVRHGQVRQISQDHSWVEEQVRAGLLTHEQARSHAQRNVITRSLGTQAEVEVDVFSEVLEEGDTLILCTDGLSGMVVEEDLQAIVEQYVPQESVYHLVERANENGGTDNITAIVVRVQEVGAAEANSSTRQLVPIGGAPNDHEDTMMLDRTPSSALSSTARTADGRATSLLPRATGTAPLFPASARSTTPLAVTAREKRSRRRLLYPTLALVIVLIVALAGGGVYYFLYLQRDVNHRLDTISQLLSNADSATDPAVALANLSSAQSELKEVTNTVLVGPQSDRVAQFQRDLVTKAKRVITNYDQQKAILSLDAPCTIAQSSAITPPSEATKPTALAQVQNEKQELMSYVLANENNASTLYALVDQKKFGDKKPFGDAQPVLVTGQGQWMFAVTRQAGPGDTSTYQLRALRQQNDGSLKSPDDHAPHTLPGDAALWSNNKLPQLLTSWDDDIYLFFYASNSPEQVIVLHYNLKKWGDAPEQSELQVSFPLRSVVALPDGQLVLLTSNGSVQRTAFNPGSSTLQQITVKEPIPTAVGIEPQDFNRWDTAFTAPDSQKAQSPFLMVQDASSLSVGKINNVLYLFVIDDAHHRVIQLRYTSAAGPTPTPTTTATPTATPTPHAGGGAVEWPEYVQQFVSNDTLSTVKGAVVDSKGGHLNLLVLPSTFTSIDITKASTCMPGS